MLDRLLGKDKNKSKLCSTNHNGIREIKAKSFDKTKDNLSNNQ